MSAPPLVHEHGYADIETTSRAFAIGVGLNLAFVFIETGFGLLSNSVALLADAGHNFSDVIGLLAAWSSMVLARRAPSARFAYGLRGSTILAALANSLLLMAAVGGIAWESIRRLSTPARVDETTIIWVALAGVVINIATALLLAKERKNDLNLRGAFLHMVADAAVSAGVLLAAFGIRRTGWLWLDPAVSLMIAVVIFAGTWSLFKESLRLSVHAVPQNIDPAEVQAFLMGLRQVGEVHDLHIWAMSTTETALTAHLVVSGGHPGDAFLETVAHALEDRFGIRHATFQIELGDTGIACRLAPDDVV